MLSGAGRWREVLVLKDLDVGLGIWFGFCLELGIVRRIWIILCLVYWRGGKGGRDLVCRRAFSQSDLGDFSPTCRH